MNVGMFQSATVLWALRFLILDLVTGHESVCMLLCGAVQTLCVREICKEFGVAVLELV